MVSEKHLVLFLQKNTRVFTVVSLYTTKLWLEVDGSGMEKMGATLDLKDFPLSKARLRLPKRKSS